MTMKTPDNQQTIPDYRLGKIGDLPLHLFDSQGPRDEQQDNIVAFTLKEPMTKDRMRALFKTMSTATNAPEMQGVLGGTTVNLVAVSKNNIIAGNLGDSLTTLFTRKVSGENLETTKLSTLHSPLIDLEKARLIAISNLLSVYVQDGRIWQNDGDRSPSVNMSRALGDSIFAPLVIQEPDIHSIDFDPDTFDYAQIAAYTDGITDTAHLIHYDLKYHAEYLGVIVDKIMEEENDPYLSLSTALAYQAMDSGLRDNTTALSIDIKALQNDQHILIGVLDGHAPEGRRMTEIAIQALQSVPDIN
jgi:serine/threonine protein phosphatase PrpC